MTTPLFSVIIPVYNVKTYLAQAVSSLLEQTYSDWEAILVDDQSTDGSDQLAKQLADQDSRLVYLQKQHGGLSDSRNYGVKQARGRYLLFLDADDWYGLDLLKQLHRAIRDNGEPDVLVFDYQSFNEQRQQLLAKTQFDPGLRRYGEVAWNKCYQRDFYQQYQFAFPQGLNFEDTAIVPVIMALAQRRVKVDYCGYYYRRMRVGSITGRNTLATIQERQQALLFLNQQFDRYRAAMTAKAVGELQHSTSGRWFLLWRDYARLRPDASISAQFQAIFKQGAIRRGFFNRLEPKYWLAGIWVWYWTLTAGS